jgi:hypothetical protein
MRLARRNFSVCANRGLLEMKKLNWKYRVFTLSLLSIILLSSPIILLSQPKPVGTINIFRGNVKSERTISINGQTAIDGQTITSPSAIETSSSGTELTVCLSKGRFINFGSNTKMNLVFDENKISGVLLRGSVAVSVQPNTTLNIETKDGFITVLNQNQENDIVVDFVGGKTRVKTVLGLAAITEISIAAGQYFIVGEPNVKNIDSTKESTPFAYFIVSIDLVISAILGNTSDLNLDNSQVNVGPIR